MKNLWIKRRKRDLLHEMVLPQLSLLKLDTYNLSSAIQTMHNLNLALLLLSWSEAYVY